MFQVRKTEFFGSLCMPYNTLDAIKTLYRYRGARNDA